MLSDEKISNLKKLFEENGIAWAKLEIRGQKFNKEKREYLQFLVDKHEEEQKSKTAERTKETDVETQKNKINWIAVGSIATAILALIGVLSFILPYISK